MRSFGTDVAFDVETCGVDERHGSKGNADGGGEQLARAEKGIFLYVERPTSGVYLLGTTRLISGFEARVLYPAPRTRVDNNNTDWQRIHRWQRSGELVASNNIHEIPPLRGRVSPDLFQCYNSAFGHDTAAIGMNLGRVGNQDLEAPESAQVAKTQHNWRRIYE